MTTLGSIEARAVNDWSFSHSAGELRLLAQAVESPPESRCAHEPRQRGGLGGHPDAPPGHRDGGDAEYLLASADWMPRNLDRRVEIAFPILDLELQAQVGRILDIQLDDTVKARRLLPDGSSVRIAADGQASLRSQERLYEATGREGILRNAYSAKVQ